MGAWCDAKMTSSARYHDAVDKQPLMSSIDGMSLAEPQYSTLNPGHHVTPYNNNCHVTSLTNHSSPYDRLQVLGGGFRERCNGSVSQTIPTNYGVGEVFSNSWNNVSMPPNIPRSRQLADAFQPSKCLPTARQLPVSFDDVISGRQRVEYYGDGSAVYPPANHITWADGPRQLCQYGKNSVSGLSASSFGSGHVTCNSTPLTIYPASSSSWLAGHPEPSYRACAEYRLSRHHVVSDVTSAECGWTGVCDFDETVWQGKFITSLEGL